MAMQYSTPLPFTPFGQPGMGVPPTQSPAPQPYSFQAPSIPAVSSPYPMSPPTTMNPPFSFQNPQNLQNMQPQQQQQQQQLPAQWNQPQIQQPQIMAPPAYFSQNIRPNLRWNSNQMLPTPDIVPQPSRRVVNHVRSEHGGEKDVRRTRKSEKHKHRSSSRDEGESRKHRSREKTPRERVSKHKRKYTNPKVSDDTESTDDSNNQSCGESDDDKSKLNNGKQPLATLLSLPRKAPITETTHDGKGTLHQQISIPRQPIYKAPIFPFDPPSTESSNSKRKLALYHPKVQLHLVVNTLTMQKSLSSFIAQCVQPMVEIATEPPLLDTIGKGCCISVYPCDTFGDSVPNATNIPTSLLSAVDWTRSIEHHGHFLPGDIIFVNGENNARKSLLECYTQSKPVDIYMLLCWGWHSRNSNVETTNDNWLSTIGIYTSIRNLICRVHSMINAYNAYKTNGDLRSLASNGLTHLSIFLPPGRGTCTDDKVARAVALAINDVFSIYDASESSDGSSSVERLPHMQNDTWLQTFHELANM